MVYSFTPATGSFKAVYRLSNESGWYVSTNLLAVAGRLYGVAPSGGANGHGTVFSVTPEGTLTVLHAYTGGADGSAPL